MMIRRGLDDFLTVLGFLIHGLFRIFAFLDIWVFCRARPRHLPLLSKCLAYEFGEALDISVRQARRASLFGRLCFVFRVGRLLFLHL